MSVKFQFSIFNKEVIEERAMRENIWKQKKWDSMSGMRFSEEGTHSKAQDKGLKVSQNFPFHFSRLSMLTYQAPFFFRKISFIFF